MRLNDNSSSKLILTTGGQLNTDRFGLSTAAAKWWYWGNSPESQISIQSSHPRWSFMNCDRITVNRAEDGHWDIEGTYYGVQGTPAAVYSLNGSLSSDPIETHPDFATFSPWVAVGSNNTNGGGFDADGVFTGFIKLPKSAGAVTNAKWVGVRDYLSPGVTWTETTVRTAAPTDLTSIGRIMSPSGPVPDLNPRNWLYNDCSYELRGRAYTIKKEWRLSGRGGWNSSIYGA